MCARVSGPDGFGDSVVSVRHFAGGRHDDGRPLEWFLGFMDVFSTPHGGVLQ